MDRSFDFTRETNLSEIEASLDAIAHPIGDRERRVDQRIRYLFLDGPNRSPVKVQVNERITLGRTSECDLAIPKDYRISRVHCSIECRSDTILLRDLQSTNGTYLNGQRIRYAYLFDNDRILIGATVLVVRIVPRSKKK